MNSLWTCALESRDRPVGYVHIDFGARAHEETSPRLRSAESIFIRRVGAQHASTTTGFDNKHCILTVGTVGRGPQAKKDRIQRKKRSAP